MRAGKPRTAACGTQIGKHSLSVIRALVFGCLLALTACATQNVPAASLAPRLVSATQRTPEALAAVIDEAGAVAVTRADGSTRRLSKPGGVLLAVDAERVVWANACSGCTEAEAADQRGLFVYTAATDRSLRLLADALPRFNEVRLGAAGLAVLRPVAGQSNSGALWLFDLETGESRLLSEQALLVSGAMQAPLAIDSGRVAWIDSPGTTHDLTLRVFELAQGDLLELPATTLRDPQDLLVSATAVAWREELTWRGVSFDDGALWSAPAVPSTLSAKAVTAIVAPTLEGDALYWTLDTTEGPQAIVLTTP